MSSRNEHNHELYNQSANHQPLGHRGRSTDRGRFNRGRSLDRGRSYGRGSFERGRGRGRGASGRGRSVGNDQAGRQHIVSAKEVGESRLQAFRRWLDEAEKFTQKIEVAEIVIRAAGNELKKLPKEVCFKGNSPDFDICINYNIGEKCHELMCCVLCPLPRQVTISLYKPKNISFLLC